MDVSLSPLGELEAIEAATYLSRFHLQHVASSPLTRAKFGARASEQAEAAAGKKATAGSCISHPRHVSYAVPRLGYYEVLAGSTEKQKCHGSLVPTLL